MDGHLTARPLSRHAYPNAGDADSRGDPKFGAVRGGSEEAAFVREDQHVGEEDRGDETI